MPDYYEDLANEMGNTDRYVQPDEEEDMPDTPSNPKDRGDRIKELEFALVELMEEYVGIMASEFQTYSNRTPWKDSPAWRRADALIHADDVLEGS